MARLTILAIEDNALSRVTLLSLGERLNLDMTVAHSIASALVVLRSQSFDLIIVEQHMIEDELGSENIIKQAERLDGIKTPLLSITAFPAKTERSQLRQAADAYLQKPYTFEQFVKAIAVVTDNGSFLRSKEAS
jgi:CheY-like chemotaxis protein